MLTYGLVAAAGAILSLLVTPMVRSLALKLGALDRSRGQPGFEPHRPRLGGLALVAALLANVAMAAILDHSFFDLMHSSNLLGFWFVAGATITVGLGSVDDLVALTPATKFVFQVLAALMVLAAGHGISAIVIPFTDGSVPLGWLALPVSLLWIVGVMNGFNLIDGLDGLGPGVGLIAAITLHVGGVITGQGGVAFLAAALAGTLVGFLYYNFCPASILLGDSGSLLLGYFFSVLSLQAFGSGSGPQLTLASVLVLGLPILDTTFAVVRRVDLQLRNRSVGASSSRMQARSLLAAIVRPDDDHIHHRLVKRGLSERQAVLLLDTVCGILGLMAILAIPLD